MKLTSFKFTKKRTFQLLLVSMLGVAISMTACQSIPPLAGAVTETFQGRQLETFTLVRPASKAVIVFENGARETINKWDKVLNEVSQDSSVFAYNRPGYGKSDKTNAPRDGQTIVAELHQMLQQRHLKPPYILVGHSMGGLYVQLFAKTYPDEVQGIVLVDALYPKIIKKPEDFPWLTRAGKSLFLNSTLQSEIDQIYATGEQVLALPSIDNKPMIRLINVPKSAGAIAVDFGVVNDDPQTISFVRKIYPNAKLVIADSDHAIQTANPELVVAAIREMQKIAPLYTGD
ncbi:alpha/beta fold hydrolase [Undibacterium sp. Ji22W]|uniref:alpha/beta fold hydrolase n=1 Tax=Undibacterium sp. Ji22W TaxID=3413038 RepID=UPI003BF405A5